MPQAPCPTPNASSTRRAWSTNTPSPSGRPGAPSKTCASSTRGRLRSRQSVNRLLADLVDEGLVRFDDDVLVIPDAARLALAARR